MTEEISQKNLSLNKPQPQGLRVSVFSKKKEERTEEDVKLAVKMLKEVPIFSSLQREDLDLDQLLTETFESMKCENFKQGEVIFKHRDKGLKFYLIIEGSVDIYLPKTNEEIEEEIQNIKAMGTKKTRFSFQKESVELLGGGLMQDAKSSPRKSQYLSSIGPLTDPPEEKPAKSPVRRSSNQLKILRPDNNEMKFDTIDSFLNIQGSCQSYEEQVICKYKKVRTLGPGAHFGELALLQDCDRTATVIAASDLHVATLSKKRFKKLSKNFNQNFNAKVDFFAKLMNRDPEASVARFCYGFKERQYAYGQRIYTQGQIPNEVFIVKSGEVELTFQETQERINSSGLPSISKNKKLTAEKIATVGPFSFLGEAEALANRPYEMTTTSHMNGTVLYVIPTKEFKNLKGTFPDVFKKFAETHHKKMNYFENRVDMVFSIKKKVADQPYTPLDFEKKVIKSPIFKDLGKMHSLKLFERKIELALSPNSRTPLMSQRGSIAIPKNEEASPKSAKRVFDFNLDLIPVSHKTPLRSTSKLRTEMTPKNDNYVLATFRDRGTPHRQTLRYNTPTLNREKSSVNYQEYSLERTVKILTDQAKIKRVSSRDVQINGPRLGMFYSVGARNGN